MKIPLIDEFKNDSSGHVVVTPQGEFQGFMIAKPMKYDPEYLSKKERKAVQKT